MNLDKQESLRQLIADVRTKIAGREPHLYDALESIGAWMDDMWQGEWEGPIMFRDVSGASRLILVESSDHETFDAWLIAHPQFTDEELQDHAREALVRMAARPIDPKDYE